MLITLKSWNHHACLNTNETIWVCTCYIYTQWPQDFSNRMVAKQLLQRISDKTSGFTMSCYIMTKVNNIIPISFYTRTLTCTLFWALPLASCTGVIEVLCVICNNLWLIIWTAGSYLWGQQYMKLVLNLFICKILLYIIYKEFCVKRSKAIFLI